MREGSAGVFVFQYLEAGIRLCSSIGSSSEKMMICLDKKKIIEGRQDVCKSLGSLGGLNFSALLGLETAPGRSSRRL